MGVVRESSFLESEISDSKITLNCYLKFFIFKYEVFQLLLFYQNRFLLKKLPFKWFWVNWNAYILKRCYINFIHMCSINIYNLYIFNKRGRDKGYTGYTIWRSAY
ncbi:unnamed protein product [Cuscuta epithymum]|uniref:Uncharacterized protein n=1 Tax=Cuscuta epithymum TaxID=186058 RepID=A0AAV0CR35_9ASTE|nr:unnamed protein product [Cuscuta epithymum]